MQCLCATHATCLAARGDLPHSRGAATDGGVDSVCRQLVELGGLSRATSGDVGRAGGTGWRPVEELGRPSRARGRQPRPGRRTPGEG